MRWRTICLFVCIAGFIISGCNNDADAHDPADIEIDDEPKPLQVSIVTDSFEHPHFITNIPEYDQISVKLSEHEQRLVLQFSELMNTSFEIESDGPDSGKWLNDTTYEWNIARTDLTTNESDFIPLEHFISQSGKKIEWNRRLPGVYVTWIQSEPWFQLDTGERIGWSDHDFLYDNILFSPDGSQYVGVTSLPFDDGHGTNSVVQLFLERKDNPPHMIEEHIFTAPFRPIHVQWIDDRRMLVTDLQKIYVYDIETNERSIVHDWTNYEGNVNDVHYDSRSDQLIIITEKPIRDTDDRYRYSYDKWIFQSLDQLIVHEADFTSATMVNWPGVPHLPARVTNDGYYWTIEQDGQIMTRFERHDGQVQEVIGKVVYADDKEAILMHEYITNPDMTYMQHLYFWDHLSSPREVSEVDGFIRMAGEQLIALNEDDVYIYDRMRDTWSLWEYQNVFFSQHEQSGLFKILE